ncbi:MAG: ferrous iron transport protein B [Bacteroidetes bacterium]|nr:MAG: ferrous iron transport protein B [Bacteroidota bacterium]
MDGEKHPLGSVQKSSLKVALIGNPNCGKSTLFNILTGLNQSTANFPGATVDKKTGSAKILNTSGKNVSVDFLDLPGAYSLDPKSPDEKIAVELLHDRNHPDHPGLTLFVADASNLKRSLYLAAQIIDLKIPVVIALNMMDVIEKRGMEIDDRLLSQKMGVRIVPISARQKWGIDLLKQAILSPVEIPPNKIFSKTDNANENHAQRTIERYRIITGIISGCLKVRMKKDEEVFSSRTDKIVTHKIWGYLIFLAVLLLIFESIFFLSTFPMQWIESLFLFFSQWGMDNLPKGEASDLLVNGVLAGLSGVVVFIPQIALLFFFIAILEDSGYMARVSFIMDKIMCKFGLNGRSVIPLLSGVACAVPAIMSTRTISNWKERLITIMVTPLMSCSARLPVYTLLIALVVPAERQFGFFNMQGVVLMVMYLIGFLAAIGSALVMQYIIKSKERSFFIMELPPYRSPRWGNVGLMIIDRVKVFLFDAGKIIIAISVILWFLASHGPGDSFAEIEKKYSGIDSLATLSIGKGRGGEASEKLEASYAGILGKTIEPAIKPLGFDWKVGIALVTSFAAREVFVGTMATIYSAGDDFNTLSIREKMSGEIDPVTGKSKYTFAVGFSLMLFYAFAMQCMSTLAIVFRETRKLKWPVIQFIYMGVLAYLASFIVYNIFK